MRPLLDWVYEYDTGVKASVNDQVNWNETTGEVSAPRMEILSMSADELLTERVPPRYDGSDGWKEYIAHHCIAGSALLGTSSGQLTVSESARSERLVATGRGIGVVRAVETRGVQPVLRITTHLGYELEATRDHRLLRYDPEVEDVRMAEAGSLSVGDLVVLQRGSAPEGNVVSGLAAEFVGFIDGDGSIDEASGAIRFNAPRDDLALRKRLEQAALALSRMAVEWPARSRWLNHERSGIVRWRQLPQTDVVDLGSLNDVHLARSLIDGGVKSRRIGRLVRGWNAEGRAAYLRGLFEADGNASKGQITLATAREPFARDVQQVLLGLGILSSVKGEHREATFGPQDLWTVRIVGGVSRARFLEQVGFMSEKKTALAVRWPVRSGAYDKSDVYPFAVPRRSGGLLRSFSTLSRLALPNYDSAAWLGRRDRARYSDRTERIREWLKNGFHFGRIVSIEIAGEAEVFDVVDSPTGRWVPNGFVVSNCASHKVPIWVKGLETQRILDHYEWHEVGPDHLFHAATYEMLARMSRGKLARPEGSERTPPTIVIEGLDELVEALRAA